MNKILVDKQDEYLLKEYHWWVGEYIFTQKKRKTIYLHRLIMNAPQDKVVDHINRNRLDNRRSNLRIVDKHLNNFNRGLVGKSKNGFRGIEFYPKSGKYRVRFEFNKRVLDYGYYKTLEEAAVKAKSEFQLLGGVL